MSETRDVVRLAALFSFLSLLSDKQAIKVGRQIVRRIGKLDPQDQETEMVRFTERVWKKQIRSLREVKLNHLAWKPPGNLDLSIWTEFRQKVSEEEFLAVLWVKVMGLSLESVAEGLGVTQGTVSYRLSRGLRFLGGLCEEGHHV